MRGWRGASRPCRCRCWWWCCCCRRRRCGVAAQRGRARCHSRAHSKASNDSPLQARRRALIDRPTSTHPLRERCTSRPPVASRTSGRGWAAAATKQRNHGRRELRRGRCASREPTRTGRWQRRVGGRRRASLVSFGRLGSAGGQHCRCGARGILTRGHALHAGAHHGARSPQVREAYSLEASGQITAQERQRRIAALTQSTPSADGAAGGELASISIEEALEGMEVMTADDR